jgi:uncharacterized cupin superfamily protein
MEYRRGRITEEYRGDGAFPIKEGDIIACPAGGKETAHQSINTSEEELRFLAVSTRLSPEIAEYSDTNRFGVLASLAPDEIEAAHNDVCRQGGGTIYIAGKVEYMDCHILQRLQSL